MGDQAAPDGIALPDVDSLELALAGLADQNVYAGLSKLSALPKFFKPASRPGDGAANPVRLLHDLDSFRSSSGHEDVDREGRRSSHFDGVDTWRRIGVVTYIL